MHGLEDRLSTLDLPALNGRECRIRTYDPLLPKQMRYLAALIPVIKLATYFIRPVAAKADEPDHIHSSFRVFYSLECLYHWANLRGSCTLSSPGSSQRLHTMFRLQSSPKLKNSCQTLPSLYLAAATINGLRPRSVILISLSFIKSGASR